jgi:hypothetical protein
LRRKLRPDLFSPAKADLLMMESCVDMSETLLAIYKSDGSTRPGKEAAATAMKRDLEQFFTTAKCTNFGSKIKASHGCCCFC